MFLKRRHFFLFLFFASFSFTQGQSYAFVKGVVTDSTGKEPLPGASVYDSRNMQAATLSDMNGHYFLKLDTGTHLLVCRYATMRPDTFMVTLSPGDTLIKNFTLFAVTKVLDVVVISAGKFEQRLEDITVSMEIIKPNIVNNKNTTSIETALEQAPGLNVLDNEPQIRGGSGFTFGVGSRVAIIVDGMPLVSGDAGRPEWGFIPVENLEQVEIIKGASSVLYGSSALSGVIHVRTAYPREKPKTVFTVNTGMYSTPVAPAGSWYGSTIPAFGGFNFFHSRIIKKRFDLVIGGNFFHDPGYIGPPRPDDPRIKDTSTNFSNSQMMKDRARVNFNTRYRFEKVKGLSAGINGNAMYSKTNFVLAWQDDSLNIYRAYPGAVFLQEQRIVNVDPYISYYSRGGFSHNLRNRVFYTGNTITNNQSNESTVFYDEYQLQKNIEKWNDFVVTGGLVSNHVFSNAKLYSGSGTPQNTIVNYSSYVQVDKKFRRVLTLSGGWRYEYFKVNDQKAVSRPIYRAGANLRVTQGTFLRASYGQGFRFPTITERFILTNVGYFGVFPNPNLQPENSYCWEVGLKQGFKIGGFRGYVDGAYFYQRYYNTIEYLFGLWQPSVAPVGFKFVNTGNSQVKGLDFSIMGQSEEGRKLQLTLLAGYTYTEPISLNPQLIYAHDNAPAGPQQMSYLSTSMNASGNVLKYRFKHTAKGDAELTYKNRISIGYSIRYYSHMQNIDSAFAFMEGLTHDLYAYFHNITPIKVISFWKGRKDVWVNDCRISYKMRKRNKISLVINNLFNRTYSLRPMKIESPRTTAIQYVYEF